MKKSKSKSYLFFCVGVILSLATSVFADIVYFKNGKSLEGRILEKTDKYIKLDIKGVSVTYFNDEIEKIWQDDIMAVNQTTPTPQVLSPSQGELYANEEYGFEIRGPKGWFKEIIPPIPKKTTREGVFFRKHAHTTGEDSFPVLSVAIDIAPENISNAVEFSKFILQQWKEKLVKYGTGVLKVIEEPREIEVNGIKGSRAIFEVIAKDGKGARNLDYKFMKENVVVSAMGIDWPSEHDSHIKEFEEAINTFKFSKY